MAEVKTVLPQAIAHPHEAPTIEHAPAAGRALDLARGGTA